MESQTLMQPTSVKSTRRVKSTIKNPCQVVWDACEKMKGARRIDVVNHCVELGVRRHTARNQYQLWFAAVNAS